MDNTKISQGISLHDVYITHYIDRISGTNLLQRLFPQRNQLRWKKLTLFIFFFASVHFIQIHFHKKFLLMVGWTCSMVAGNTYFTNF